MTEETPKSSDNSEEKTSKSENHNPLQETKKTIELLTPILAAVGSILLFANWLLEWIKNPQISLTAFLTSLIILILSLSWYIYRYRKSDERNRWIVILIFLLVFAISLGAVLGFVRGQEMKPAKLLAIDNSTYNFEQDLQGWKMGCSPKGKKLGTLLERTSEQVFAGSYALKYEQAFEEEASVIGIGRIESLPQHRGGELAIAYVRIPADAPTNVEVTFFTYYELDSSQDTSVVYTDDSKSKTILRPDHWNTLVWEVPKNNNAVDIGIGLKFRLVPKWDQLGSEHVWEEGVIYIDAVQIIGHSPTGRLVLTTLPSETPTGSALEPTPSPETPTATPTHVALATTPSPTSTPVPVAVVTAEALHLREGPGIEYEVIRALAGGETLTLLGITSNGDWLLVRTSKQEEGWVHAAYVDSDRNLDVIPTVTATPTRTWLDAPVPLSPLTEERASCVNQVRFEWKWIRDLAKSEYFSVRVSQQDTEEECFHDKTQDTVYSGPLPSCNAGTLCWETVAVRLFSTDPEIWIELSPPSEPQCFDFAQETPAPPTDTPAPPPPGGGGGGGGGGGPICPPPC